MKKIQSESLIEENNVTVNRQHLCTEYNINIEYFNCDMIIKTIAHMYGLNKMKPLIIQLKFPHTGIKVDIETYTYMDLKSFYVDLGNQGNFSSCGFFAREKKTNAYVPIGILLFLESEKLFFQKHVRAQSLFSKKTKNADNLTTFETLASS